MSNDKEKIYANALNQCLKIGPVSLRKIKETFGSFENGWRADIQGLQNITGAKEFPEFRKGIDPEKEYEILKNENITVLLKDELPEMLREIPVPPEILYTKGSLPDSEKTHLAVVGTRKFSTYGKEATEKLIRELRDYDIVIVSGMALGIDTIAHKTALKNKMKTVAVLACGFEESIVYPPQNKKLSQEITEAGGCLVSEYPYTMRAAMFTFPQRNRIVAGMTKGTLVAEAPQKSGSLITAFMALEYGREVFAVPGPIFSENSKGTNILLKLGAMATTDYDDILKNLGIESQTKTENIQFSAPEQKIISALSEPTEKDELIRQTGLPAREVIPILTQMEIRGIIKEAGGQIYKII